MNAGHDKPLMARILPDLLAFTAGLGIAYWADWETKDLVWSLWLCSLGLGYLSFFSAIGGGFWLGLTALRNADLSRKQFRTAVLAGTAVGLFLLGFFSLHFGAFHAAHSAFLQQFFPVEGMPEDGFGAAFMNPPLLWTLTIEHLIRPYGLFLVPAIIAERHYVFRPLINAIKGTHGNVTLNELLINSVTKRSGARTILGDAMGRPYLNVIRMHVLIFFFAFSHELQIDSFTVYAVVYAVYFFPWREVRTSLQKS